MNARAQVEMKPDAARMPAQTPVPFGTLQRKCACGGSSGASGGPGECPECKKKKTLQRRAIGTTQPDTAPPIVHDVLRSPGQPLDAATRAYFEPRFGHNFGSVRIHTDAKAAESARAVNALAYTAGSNLVFGAGQYQPNRDAGRRLLGHELTHVIQQRGQSSSSGELRIGPTDDAHEMEADRKSRTLTTGLGPTPDQGMKTGQALTHDEFRGSESSAAALVTVQRQAGGGGGGAAASPCAIPAGCPADFCSPMNPVLAQAERATLAPVLLAGIGAKVSPRVVPLWNTYIFGGSAPQDLSAKFGTDFTNSKTTSDTTDFLIGALKASLESNPPTFPTGKDTVNEDLPPRIGPQIAEIGDPNSGHPMDFNVIGEIPGNIAGGIGKNQTTCMVGAQPSPFNDDRTAAGTTDVKHNPDDTLTAVPAIEFTVQDTIDLCPGNCGASIEQVATVPMSRWEATGISGDVPFTVKFPAPPRTITTAKVTPTPTPTPAPPAPATGPVSGEVTASALFIRTTPSTSVAAVGSYPRGAAITILCETTGENVEGNTTWDKTDRGFVSDRYVNRTGTGKPPAC
jgi:hypothetical protein